MTGSFAEAVETASEILRVNGVVIPATLDNVRLKMEWQEASTILHGERVIDADFFKYDPRRADLSLVPSATANPTALAAIEQADLIVIAPGDLYTSLGPLLVIDGVGEALQQTNATIMYVSNLVTKQGQTAGFCVSDHAAEIERFIGGDALDYVLYNEQVPTDELAQRYEEEHAYLVEVDHDVLKQKKYAAIGGSFLGVVAEGHGSADVLPVTRSLIRHDSDAVARAIIDIYRNSQLSSN
jgi:uncharacterized cofD-like protein